MKCNTLAVMTLSIASATICGAQTSAASAPQATTITQSQIKQMVKDAHTPAEYKILAGYYQTQQESYLREAAEEKKEWARRSQYVVLSAAKYPRPVDEAKYLYEYYSAKADESGKLFVKYSDMSSPASSAQVR